MKKRLLALALCLVMAVSLLPVTALADDPYPIFSGLEDLKTYCGEVQFSVSVEGDVGTVSVSYSVSPHNYDNPITPDGDGKYTLPAGIGQVRVEANNKIGSSNNYTAINVTVNNGQHTWNVGTPVGNGKHSLSCSICTNTKTEDCVDTDRDHKCDFCPASVHTWSYEVSKAGDNLTATCTPNCPIGEVSVSLKAHSVTLPDSPFNARLEGKKEFEDATGAVISTIRYDYKGSDGVWQKDVNPVAANAKAGEYQAFVQITGLPGPVESDGPVAMAENPDGTYTADLYVKYTAADPAVTAQTGDDRPIELMLVCALAFSALAAAAFILDSKRKYSR